MDFQAESKDIPANKKQSDDLFGDDHSPLKTTALFPGSKNENDNEKSGADDFEHVQHENFATKTATDDIFPNLKTKISTMDTENEFAHLTTTTEKEAPSDILNGANILIEDKINATKDFMAAERQGGYLKTDANITETIDPSGRLREQEIGKTSPVSIKKNLKEDSEKFISSEDLLSDFKDAQNPIEQFKIADTEIHITSKEENDKQNLGPDPLLLREKPQNAERTKQLEQKDVKIQNPIPMISAEEIFCRFGLVESLIYWRDVKKTGIIFGAGLVILLAISCYSVISVFAYVSLLTLIGTVSFRIYKNILGAVQKTSDGHPFKEYLEQDLTLSQEKVQHTVNVAVAHFNATILELRRLFLVENLVDSLKFGFVLWTCTYVGAWFNGMTLVILAFVALFTLPKVYENNKQSIDTYLDLVRSKFLEITDKVKAAVPIGKKQESDKEK